MFSEIDDLTPDLTLDLADSIIDDLIKFSAGPMEPYIVGSVLNISNRTCEDSLDSWEKIPMIQWSAGEVIDFIKTLGNSDMSVERFECISGNIFKTLGIEYCQRLAGCEEQGAIIFQAKENYIRNNPFSNSEDDYPRDFHSIYSDTDTTNTQHNTCDILEERAPKRVGRPKTDSKKRIKAKSEKLPEFLLNLLGDKRTDLIKWENYEEGTFKFVNSNTVARLWGNRNHNNSMNYEKFTRALRYHYKNEVLLPVRGKRLVYKFGPQAKGLRS